jgi:uncharacterized membrane protein YbhN (UPF0104 family)
MSESPPTSERRSTVALIVKAIVAIGVSVVTLGWAFHDVDLGHVKANLGNTTAGALALYAGAHCVLHLSRVVRFALLIPKGVGPRSIFAAVSVGLPAAFFLPLRLGELVRPAMLSRVGVPFAGAMAAVAVERIADGLFNVGLFFLLLGTLPADAIPGEVRALSQLALGGFGGGLLFLVAAYFARQPVLGLLEKIVSPISKALATKLVHLTSTFLDGLTAVGTAPRFLAFLGLTAFFWLSNGVATWILASSYVGTLPLAAGSFAICTTVFAVMIPAGPAFAGTLEAGFRLGLTPYGVASSETAVIALASHAVHLVMMAAFAGAGLLAAEPGQRPKAEAEAVSGSR